MDRISKIVYINLERRKDRREQIEHELITMGLSGERFEAINRQPGIIGCGLSHLAILKKAQEEQWNTILILEDDFEWLVSKESCNDQLQAFWDLNIEWDVLMLSYNLIQYEPYNDLVGRVKEASTASGYIVNRHFYPQLITILETGIQLLEKTGEHWHYANDQYWKQLQPVSQWFYFILRIGKQRGSFSDNSNKYMDYGV